jgi:hypothetical protein
VIEFSIAQLDLRLMTPLTTAAASIISTSTVDRALIVGDKPERSCVYMITGTVLVPGDVKNCVAVNSPKETTKLIRNAETIAFEIFGRVIFITLSSWLAPITRDARSSV